MSTNYEKKLFLVSLCLFCVTAGPLLASAYYLSGDKWASIYIDPLQYYSTSKYSTDVSTCTTNWNDGVDDIVLSTGPSSCIYKIYDYSDYEDESDGYCWTQAVGGYFYVCTVYLNTYWIDGLSYPAAERRSVIAHEMGHAFGLAHNEGPYIMNPYTRGVAGRYSYYGISTPQSDDCNGVDAIY